MTANVPAATARVEPVGFAELGDDFSQTRQDTALVHGKAEDLVGLSENDRERHTVEEADEDWLRQEICEHAQAKEARADADEAREQCKCGGERSIGRRIADGEWRDRSRDHGARCRVGADDQLARAAEDGIGDERQDSRVEANFRREPGQLRIGDADRHRDRRNRETRLDISGQIGGLISKQLGKAGRKAVKRRHSAPLCIRLTVHFGVDVTVRWPELSP